MKILLITLLILPFTVTHSQPPAYLSLHIPAAGVGDTVLISYAQTPLCQNYEEHLLTLDNTHKATISLPLTQAKEITLSYAETAFVTYIEPGDTLNAEFKRTTLIPEAIFSGSAASAAVLYADYQYRYGTFNQQAEAHIEDCLQLTPAVFLEKQDSLLTAQLAFIASRSEMVSANTHRQLHDRAIYTGLMNKLRYPALRCYMTKVPYPELRSAMDANGYYDFVSAYRAPVSLPALCEPVLLALWEMNRFYYQQERGDNVYSATDELNCAANRFSGEVGELVLVYSLLMQFAGGTFTQMDSAFAFVNGKLTNIDYKILIANKYYALRYLQAGNPAPGLDESRYMFAGKAFRIDSLRGKTILMEFWHSGCAPCLDGFAKTKELYGHLPENVLLVFVCADPDIAQARQTVRKYQLPGIHVHAPGQKHPALQAYQIQSFPTWVLIAPDGTIINANAPRPGSKELAQMLNLNPE
jgi:thiol-disulfide isomerase/thioredoxin